MKVRFWGTRGSLASPSPETVRYGGNTSCISVEGSTGDLLVLDAGTGLRNLASRLEAEFGDRGSWGVDRGAWTVKRESLTVENRKDGGVRVAVRIPYVTS